MKTQIILNLSLILCGIIAVLILIYIAMVSYFLLMVKGVHTSAHFCILHKFQRYCASVPRNESIPVTAVERLLEAIECGNTEVDIDAIVIEEIFKTQKR